MKGKSNFRMGHLEGKSDIAFSPDGKFILSCGTDGLVQKWDLDAIKNEDSDGYEPSTVYEHKDGATSLAFSKMGDAFATGSADHHVNLFQYPSCKFETTVTRAQLDIRHIAFSPDGSLLAVAGEDSTIRIVNLVDSNIIVVFKGHEGPIRSVSYDPKGDFIASAGTDGTVRIWSMKEREEVKSLAIVPKGEADRALQLTRLDWQPNGELLAVPTPEGIRMIRRGTWEVAFTLEGEHKKEGANIFRWSPDSRLGASAGLVDNSILIWDMTKRETVDKLKYTSGFMGLAWSPSSQNLVMIAEDGQWNLWEGVNEFLSSKSSSSEKKTAEAKEKPEEQPELSKDELLKSLFLDEEAEEDDMDEEDVEAEEEAEAEDEDLDNIFAEDERKEAKKMKSKEEEPGLKDKMGKLQEKRRLKRGTDSIDSNEDGKEDAAMMVDDPLDDEIIEYVENDDVEEVQVSSSKPTSSNRLTRRTQQPLQPTFQPNSSPTSDAKRYFAWTLFGSISSYSDSSIEIQFSDQMERRNIHISNANNFSMGSLGLHGVLLAAKSSNEGYPSNVLYRPFNSWTTNAEWSANMPTGEEVEAIAVGKGWAAAATSRSWLRLFSYSGVQTALIKLPGRVVCMTGYQDLISIVYHCGAALKLMTLDTYSKKTIISTNIPIDTENVTLTWIGHSEEGVLLIADSNGYVYGLFPQFDWQWTPLLDFYEVKKNKHEGHWIIGLTEDKLVYVPLAPGVSSPPVTAQRPPTQFFTVSIPVLRDTDVRLQEEKSIRGNLYYVLEETMAKLTESLNEEKSASLRKVQAKCDGEILLMIKQAIATKEQVRALDLSGMLHLPKSLTIAKALAEGSNLTELARRIDTIFEAKKVILQVQKDAEDRQKLLSSMAVEQKRNPTGFQLHQPQQPQPLREREREKEKEEEAIRLRKFTPLYDSDAETMGDEGSDKENDEVMASRHTKKRKIEDDGESEREKEEVNEEEEEREEEEDEESEKQQATTREKVVKEVDYFNPFAVVKRVDEVENTKNTSKSLFGALGAIQSKMEKDKKDSTSSSATSGKKKGDTDSTKKKKGKKDTSTTKGKKAATTKTAATGGKRKRDAVEKPLFAKASNK